MLGGREVALDLRLVMGRQWLRLIDGIGDLGQAFTDAYAIPPPDPASPVDADRVAHPEVWQAIAAVAGRRMDGGRLYLHLRSDPANKAYDGVAGVAETDKDALDKRAERFVRWCERLLRQPPADGDDAWAPRAPGVPLRGLRARRRTARRCSPPTSTPAGRWTGTASTSTATPTALGADADPPPAATTQTLIPVPLEYEGMPNTRWWAFEDRRTNFGAIDAATTDLAKLLFVEFGLVYANDWFLVPCPLPDGTLATVRGVAVTNVFGERTWIEPAGTGSDDDWQRWSMFTLSVAGSGPQEAAALAAARADRPEGAGGRAGRGGPARPRRDGEHGVGRRAGDPDAGRREQAGVGGGDRDPRVPRRAARRRRRRSSRSPRCATSS